MTDLPAAIAATQTIAQLERLYGEAQLHEETLEAYRRRWSELVADAVPAGPSDDPRADAVRPRPAHRTPARPASHADERGDAQLATDTDTTFIGADDDAVVPPPADPMAVSRTIVGQLYRAGSSDRLLSWRGGFYEWDGRCWQERPDATIRAAAYRFLEHADYVAITPTASERRPWQPTRAKIANVIEALRAVTHLPDSIEPPAWLGDRGPASGSSLDPHELVATANGILHVPTRQLMPHDPRLFITRALPFAFNQDAPEPSRWLAFLEEVLDDADSIALAQEIAGYLVSGERHLQKIALLVGPTRAGKGVFANVISALVGRPNVGAPTLQGLTTNFGLQDLIGKSLAVVSDARLGPSANVAALAERLLSVSGEDAITIDRKHRDPWTGRLGVRFLLLTNELPRFRDASGALAKRFVVLVFGHSFYGREDPTLLGRLLPDLPGILNWALDGRDRLHAQGHFTVPAAASDAIRALEDLASPVGAFVRDRCAKGVQERAAVDELWGAWKAWCEEQSHHPGTKQTFGRDLRAAVPGLRVEQPREGHERRRDYLGVGLLAHGAEDRVPRVPDDPSPAGGTDGTRSAPPSSAPDVGSTLVQRADDPERPWGADR